MLFDSNVTSCNIFFTIIVQVPPEVVRIAV